MDAPAPDGVTVRHLTEEDLPGAALAFRTSLGSPAPDEQAVERYRQYWDVDRSLVAVGRDGRVLGVAATFATELTVEGGASVPCAAVPSVGVRPDSHGVGIGRALLTRQVREADERGAAVLALNASEVGIYGRYGYGPTSRWWSIRADPRMLRWRADAPRAAAGSITDHHDLDEVRDLLPTLHDRVVGRWSGELARPASWWAAALHPAKDTTSRTWAVHRDDAGVADAAMAYTTRTAFDDVGFANRVEVHDSVATDPATEALVWRWLLERHLGGRVEAERANPRLPLHWMLVDPRALVTRFDGDAAWVRVLDVPRVLGARTTRATGAVAVRVVDPVVDRNDRCWRLSGEGGRLTVTEVDDQPEVTVGVDLLASLAWGFARARVLADAGRIDHTGDDALRRLDALLATDGPAWCSTGF